MNEQLRKRLEEVALKISCVCPPIGQFGTGNYEPAEFDEDAYKAALKGAEWGYKEAIAQAKEWLKTSFFQCQGDDDVYWDSAYSDITEALEFFESDMNKLFGDGKD